MQLAFDSYLDEEKRREDFLEQSSERYESNSNNSRFPERTITLGASY